MGHWLEVVTDFYSQPGTKLFLLDFTSLTSRTGKCIERYPIEQRSGLQPCINLVGYINNKTLTCFSPSVVSGVKDALTPQMSTLFAGRQWHSQNRVLLVQYWCNDLERKSLSEAICICTKTSIRYIITAMGFSGAILNPHSHRIASDDVKSTRWRPGYHGM